MEQNGVQSHKMKESFLKMENNGTQSAKKMKNGKQLDTYQGQVYDLQCKILEKWNKMETNWRYRGQVHNGGFSTKWKP